MLPNGTGTATSSTPTGPQIARLRGTRRDLYALRCGGHSVWARLLIAQPPYHTLVGEPLVVVLFEDRLELRLSRTAFTMTLHYADVTRLTHCPLRQTLFFATNSPAGPLAPPATWEAAEAALSTVSGRGPIPHATCSDTARAERVYMLELLNPRQAQSHGVFNCLVPMLPPAARACSGEEESSIDTLLSFLISSPRSPLLVGDLSLLCAAGLDVISPRQGQAWVQRWARISQPPAERSTATPPVEANSTTSHAREANDVSQGPTSAPLTTAPDLTPSSAPVMSADPAAVRAVSRGPEECFRIYHAPCPAGWWPVPTLKTFPAASETQPPPHDAMWPTLRGRRECVPQQNWTGDAHLVVPPRCVTERITERLGTVPAVMGPRLVPMVISTDYRVGLLDVEYGPAVKL